MTIKLRKINVDGFWDKAGALLSWLCAVHCLVLPLAAALLPLYGLGFLLDERAEWLAVALSASIALVSLLPAYLHRHRRRRVLMLFTAGLGAIACAHLLFEEEAGWKIALVLGGAGLISAAHLFNYRAGRRCLRCAEESAN